MNHEAVTARAMDLHEKASMPLALALELALSEAAPSPVWPCAKMVIKDGRVSLLSYQYAPGLPDGEHDVYPLPVDSDACPAGVQEVPVAEQKLCSDCGLDWCGATCGRWPSWAHEKPRPKRPYETKQEQCLGDALWAWLKAAPAQSSTGD